MAKPEHRSPNTESRMANIDVVILCGGMGTRLRSVVADRPKPMAIVDRRPFLDIVIDPFRRAGFRRCVLCTGHLSEAIEAFYQGPSADLEIVISREPAPLGTAGAVRHAEHWIRSDPFLVANGDSLCKVDLAAFVRFHQASGAALSMVVAPSQDPKDYGTVIVDSSQRITAFAEKAGARPGGLISAGIYLLGRQVLSLIPAGVKSSLEYDVFPNMVAQPCYAFVGSGPVLDIGTPERLRKARQGVAGISKGCLPSQ